MTNEAVVLIEEYEMVHKQLIENLEDLRPYYRKGIETLTPEEKVKVDPLISVTEMLLDVFYKKKHELYQLGLLED